MRATCFCSAVEAGTVKSGRIWLLRESSRSLLRSSFTEVLVCALAVDALGADALGVDALGVDALA
eukprot:SAG31_NODE_1294_length_8954_cov_2.434557_5_plen_65_part_00